MRLINTSKLTLHEFDDSAIPEYAILSHTWGEEEVTFRDLQDGLGPSRKGWCKITNFCKLAENGGSSWGWIDTCCIDKSSSAELSEAINSMFRWYRDAFVCYAYICDLTSDTETWQASEEFARSVWFTRSWTLQELLAPKAIIFYNFHWQMLGTVDMFYPQIFDACGIERDDFPNYKDRSVARRMSWAAKRKCTRPEDMAYSLLGLFDVNMPLLYGEGSEKAFLRLQMEILWESDDESIFAWMEDGKRSGLLATSPKAFINSYNVSRCIHISRKAYTMTNKGLHIGFHLLAYNPFSSKDVECWRAPLNCSADTRPGSALAIFLVRKITPFPFGLSFLAGYPLDAPQYYRLGPLVSLPRSVLINMSPAHTEVWIPQKDRSKLESVSPGLNASEQTLKFNDNSLRYLSWESEQEPHWQITEELLW